MKMNPIPPGAAGPACRACAPLLPLLHAGELTEEQEAALRTHLASCGRCQKALAAYDTLEAAMRRHFGKQKGLLFASMEELMEHAETHDQAPVFAGAAPLLAPAAPTAPTPLPPRRLRRRLSWISLVAAVLAMAFILTGLFISRHPPTTGKHTTPIPSAPQSVYLTPSNDQSTNNEMVALNASNSAVRWRYKTGVAEVAPVLQDGVLYIGSSTGYGTASSQGYVYAFRASDGTLLWHYQALQAITRLKVNAGVVYVSAEGVFPEYVPTEQVVSTKQVAQTDTYAFRASDGTLLWRFDQGTLEAVGDGMVYISAFPASLSMDTPLYAVNPSDGSIKWKQDNDPEAGAGWFVYPADGILYTIPRYISFGGPLPVTLHALNPGTGQQLWSRSSLGGLIAAEPQVAVVEGTAIGAYNPLPPTEVYGLNPADGSVLWHLQLASPTRISGIASSNGVLYLCATDKTLSAIDASTGSTLWQVTLAAAGAPSLTADGLLVISASGWSSASNWPPGRLEVRDASNGSLKWAYQSPHPAADGLNVQDLVNGTLYTYIYDWLDPDHLDTVLSAFNASNGTVKWQYDLGTNPYEFVTVG